MKKLLIAAVVIGMTVAHFTGASRADVTMKLPDNITETFKTMGAMLDQCIGSTISKSDGTSCQQLRAILVQLQNQPTTPAPAPDDAGTHAGGGAGDKAPAPKQ